MRILKYFSTLIFVGVTAAIFMTTVPAHAQHVYPWPPNVRCPVRWHRYRGRYRVQADIISPYGGHVVEINIRRSHSRLNLDYLQITQYARDGKLYAEGETYLPVHSRSLREIMRVPGTNQMYMVELNAYTREQTRDCDERNLIIGISFYPMNAYRVEVAPQYFLIPLN